MANLIDRDIDMVWDFEKTFGECLFYGFDSETFEKVDGEGEDVENLGKYRRYNIACKRQEEVLRVSVSIEKPLIDLPFRTPCKLVGVGIRPVSEESYFISAENIVKVGSALEAGGGKDVSVAGREKSLEDDKFVGSGLFGKKEDKK